MPAIRSKEERRRLGVRVIVLIRRLASDQSGVTAAVVAMTMTMILGVAGLGTEVGTWYVTKRNMQGAADAAAYSAAVAGGHSESYSADGTAVAASFGYVNGSHSVTVNVNNPPTLGAYAGVSSAYEVIISQPQPQLFSKLFMASATTIKARAVAATTGAPNGCVLTLGNTNATGVTLNGNVTLSLTNCSLIDNSTGPNSLLLNGNDTLTASSVVLGGTANVGNNSNVNVSNGILTDQTAAVDPYKNVDPGTPATCVQGGRDGSGVYYNKSITGHQSTTLDPGTYCGGITINASTVTFNPGIYYLNDGSLAISGNSTITGAGVTIVFTSDNGNYGTLAVNGSPTITLSAPTSGPTEGFVFFESGNAPTHTVTFNGGNTLNLTGIVYFPSQNLKYNGEGNSTCAQVVANTITFNGSSNFGGDCSNVPGVDAFGNATTKLVE